MSRTDPEKTLKSSEIFRVGDFLFDPKRLQLQNLDHEREALRSQSAQVLAELLKDPGVVVSKDALVQSVWADTFVTDDSLVQCISDIRRAIGDSDYSIIQTIPKQGYLVIAEPYAPEIDTERTKKLSGNSGPGFQSKYLVVAALAVLAIGVSAYSFWPTEPLPIEKKSVPLPTGPRIALIPFENLGEDPNDTFFSEGLTRDINAQLSRFSNLFVIAPTAGEAFRDNPDCETIREELRADYILTGTVQRYNQRLRVTTAFQDAETCLQLPPPGPFDRDMSIADVLDIQLEIASQVAAEVGSGDAPLFNVAVQREIREKAPESLDAYECVLLSYWFYQTFGLEAHRRARACLERTVKEEPGYSLGWSRLAFTYLESKKRAHDTPPDWAELARVAANNAFDTDRDNPDAYYAMAIRSRMLGEDISVFRSLAERAITLNPNDSWILADLGIFLAYSGAWEEGKEWITRARALNPKLHIGYTNAWVLHAFVRGDYAEARNYLLNMPKHGPMNWVPLTASYALNGEQEMAEETLAHIQTNWPDFLKDPLAPFRARSMPQQLIDKLMMGLDRAGYEIPSE
ncbi:winged helix-turn-helix domain-containing protein [Alisedimentitalea sp. MJ-SS2]|uniref:winged helix-turn-helix domain-containing protein n=1 Tax=Aliisedimentitalea sp. MJ-SS2 TaxID=3049795 RepID=UPI0029139A13|nr:winged helix-turn-helix domain-containing protein [Alisedimentitalea sp. MJ-SS2]MDU8928984.1 winged helix-turn-helix domain-containing protein [Alisedimentitalea sp. MJ-SS2]